MTPLEEGGTGKETGWLSKWAFQKGALAADSIGRQAVADGFITERMVEMFLVESMDWSTLPTSDPGIYGLPWIDETGHVAISAGATLPSNSLINPKFFDFSNLPTTKPAMNGLAWIDETGHVAISDGATPATGSLVNPAYLDFSLLPTSDPAVAGRAWMDETAHLAVSAG